MIRRNLFFAVVLVLAFCSFSYSEELASKEAGIYYSEGLEAYKNGDAMAASGLFQKAFLLDRSFQKAVMNNLASIHALKGDVDKAEEIFKDILKVDPDYKTALMNLGILYNKMGERTKALEAWAQAFKHEIPNSFLVEEDPWVALPKE